MSHGVDGKRRRGISDWVVQPLEGRVLLSTAGEPASAAPSAQVASTAGQQPTTTALVSATQVTAGRTVVILTAKVSTASTNRLLSGGTVRFSVVSPTGEGLGAAHVNKLGQATLRTLRLDGGGNYVIQAQFIPPGPSFATSTAHVDVQVAPPLVTSFRITAPRYYGAPGTPVDYSVTALDRQGQAVSDYTGTVSFSSPTDHSAKFLAKSYTFTTADQGTADFPDGVTFHKGGAELLKVIQLNNTQVNGKKVFGIE